MCKVRFLGWIGVALVVAAAVSLGCGKRQTVGMLPPAGPVAAGSGSASDLGETARLDSASIDGIEGDLVSPEDLLRIQEGAMSAPVGRAPSGPKVQIPELRTVYFDFDTSEVRPDQESILRDNAAYLLTNPGVRVEVQGHCDERGTETYNLSLGDRRALAIRSYLNAAGVSPDRIYTISYGEAVPAVEGETEAAFSQNRRAEFWVVSEQ